MKQSRKMKQSKMNDTLPVFKIYESSMNFSHKDFVVFVKEEMIYQGFDNKQLAEAVGIDRHRLAFVLAGKFEFNDYEIEKLKKKLGI